jgi:hypothetical protein
MLELELRRFVCLAIALGGLAARAEAGTYTFTTLNPATSVNAFNRGGINNSGDVAAGFNGSYVYNGSTYSHGSSSISQVTAIDDSGNIVGFTGAEGLFGPLHSPSTFAMPGSTSTEAEGVSDNGMIAGFYVNGTPKMFIKDGSNITTFSCPGGGSQQYLWDANDSSDAVGLSACGSQGVSFLKQGNTFSTISVPGISNHDVVAYGLNDRHTVVGYDHDDTTEHGFIWQNGTSTTFDFPGATATILFNIERLG